MRWYNKMVVVVCFVATILGCSNQDADFQRSTPKNKPTFTPDSSWLSWWQDGKAEISTFDLVQARYGELRHGEAVMIFVTEPFSSSQHVKSDHPERDPADIRQVMKLNFARNFVTGIYPYSILSSTFTPIDGSRTLKNNLSCQEWCGHVFTELDMKPEGYQLTGHSYFESEVEMDTLFRFSGQDNDFRLEDEIWNLLRFDPWLLDKDTLELIPSMTYLRLLHIEPKPYTAFCSLSVLKDDRITFKIYYPELERTLEIYLEESFPHVITGWSETYRDGWTASAPMLTSTGKLKKSLRTDYWNLNSVSDSVARKELGL